MSRHHIKQAVVYLTDLAVVETPSAYDITDRVAERTEDLVSSEAHTGVFSRMPGAYDIMEDVSLCVEEQCAADFKGGL